MIRGAEQKRGSFAQRHNTEKKTKQKPSCVTTRMRRATCFFIIHTPPRPAPPPPSSTSSTLPLTTTAPPAKSVNTQHSRQVARAQPRFIHHHPPPLSCSPETSSNKARRVFLQRSERPVGLDSHRHAVEFLAQRHLHTRVAHSHTRTTCKPAC